MNSERESLPAPEVEQSVHTEEVEQTVHTAMAQLSDLFPQVILIAYNRQWNRVLISDF